MAKKKGSGRGGAKAKRVGKRPARKVAGKKAPARKPVAGKLAVKTKVPKARAKGLIDDFQGKKVDIAPEEGTTGATLTMLQVSPTKAHTD